MESIPLNHNVLLLPAIMLLELKKIFKSFQISNVFAWDFVKGSSIHMILWLWLALEFEELQFTWFWGLLERGSRMAWNLTTCLFDLKVWSFMWRYVTLQHCYAPWFFRQEDDEYWFRYTCPVHDPKTDVRYYNDLASLYFAIPSQVPTIPLQNGVMASHSKFDRTNISACVPPEILNFKSYQVASLEH